MVEQGKELVKGSPADLIMAAVTGRADLEKLEKLLAIQERWEANEARKLYHKAMAAFKANPPKIEKDKKVGYSTNKGEVGYSHASLANVTDKISAELSKHGLSASWQTKQNGKVVVICKITHEAGHSEETILSAEADVSGAKNSIQAIGSTITYLQRYTLLSITGLATSDMDDDGRGATEFIDDNQLGQIRDYLAALNMPEKKFLEYMKIEDIEKMPKSAFKKAIAALEATKKSKEKK